jgi:hypothetical protein
MSVLSGEDRLRLRQLYVFRCGYCGITEIDVGGELTEDHFHPVARGGSNALENIVYACHICNTHKKDYWNPDGIERILHPLNDDLTIHLRMEEDGAISGLTGTGAFHIRRLHLNRPGLVAYRRRMIAIERNDARIARIEQSISELHALLEEFSRRLP